MSKLEVNTVAPQCGTTLTLGESGDTVTLGSGASQTGFGRTGTVDWQTTIKTGDFTAVSGEGYFVNTTSGAITVTLPASPSAGAIVSIKDYAQTFDTNACTIGRNSSNIAGTAADVALATEGISVTFIYADATKGWLVTSSGLESDAPSPAFVTATGGTITTSGDFKIHTFTGPGTFAVSCAGNAAGSNTVDYLVVAGAGGAAGDIGGGGGAGGFRLSNSTCMPAPLTSPLASASGIPVSATSFPITVGGGGTGAPSGNAPTTDGTSGSNSVFSTITSAGGGGTGYDAVGGNPTGNSTPGGSGGGAKRGAGHTGGSGNTPPVSPPQGNNGGNTPAPPNQSPSSKTRSAGGGGAGGVGQCGSNTPACTGAGGIGSFVVQTGFAGCNGTPGPVSSARYFAGGGSGGGNASFGSPPNTGTFGGGGAGASGDDGPNGNPGTTNTGGGGSGGGNDSAGGNGGSGIVVIRYKFQ